MIKKIISAVSSLVFTLFFASSLDGFDNNPNWVDPEDRSKGLKEYTRERALIGEYYGGHDTLTAEGMLLKEKVHQGKQTF